MAKNKVGYVPNPNPHPQAGSAPATGVPTNPVPAKVAPTKHASEVGGK